MMRSRDIEEQAAAFLGWHFKRGQPVELDFSVWAASKDFVAGDRLRIWRAASAQLIAAGAAVFTDCMEAVR